MLLLTFRLNCAPSSFALTDGYPSFGSKRQVEGPVHRARSG